MFCWHRNNCIYTVYMKLVRNVIISLKCSIKFYNWSRLVALPSSDEMKMFYREHDFQVDLENTEFNLKFYAEAIQYICLKM